MQPINRLPNGIPATKLADGSVSDAEFQRLNGVSSDIQTQLDGKAASSHTHAQSDITSLTSDLAAKAPLASPTFSGTLTSGGDVIMTSLVAQVRTNSSDGSDTRTLALCSGGSSAASRGAALILEGNEAGNFVDAGAAVLRAGNIAGAYVDLQVANTSVHRVNHDKSVTLDATYAASLASALGGGSPTGTVAMWGTGSAPTGWLLADGSAVSRTTYATLFALIGTTFGSGNGSTTFTLPDFRGRAPIGAGTGSGLTARTLAGKVGAEMHTLTGAESGLKAHSVSGVMLSSGGSIGDFSSGSRGPGSASVGAQDASSGHNNMQPSLVVNFIIKT